MKKYNFELRPDNVNEFIKRIDKLFSVTQVLVVDSNYLGVKELNTTYKKLTGKRSPLPWIKNQGFLDANLLTNLMEVDQKDYLGLKANFGDEPKFLNRFQSNGKGVWIRTQQSLFGIGFRINYGTKMFFTPTSVTFKDKYRRSQLKTYTYSVRLSISSISKETLLKDYLRELRQQQSWDSFMENDNRINQ